MIAVLNNHATDDQLRHFVQWIENRGFRTNVSRGDNETIVGIIGDTSRIDPFLLESMDIVDRVQRVSEPFKLASRKFHPHDTVIDCGQGVLVGGGHFQVIAGPNAVGGSDLEGIAARVRAAGATMLYGGVYNPRTTPYSFRGMVREDLDRLVAAGRDNGMPTVTEIMDPRDVGTLVDAGVGVIQVGARNMQNFPLLKELGRTRVPVLVKRGLEATVDEWIMAAEFVMSEGNERVILCERGTRTAETRYRHALDVSAVVAAHGLSHLPVIADPSRAAGYARYVPALALAATAAGADGLEVDVHDTPEGSLSDGGRALTPEGFSQMMGRVEALHAAMAEGEADHVERS